MSRETLATQIAALADAAQRAGELPAALVLFTLAGALHSGGDRTLSRLVAVFAEQDLARIQAAQAARGHGQN